MSEEIKPTSSVGNEFCRERERNHFLTLIHLSRSDIIYDCTSLTVDFVFIGALNAEFSRIISRMQHYVIRFFLFYFCR